MLVSTQVFADGATIKPLLLVQVLVLVLLTSQSLCKLGCLNMLGTTAPRLAHNLALSHCVCVCVHMY